MQGLLTELRKTYQGGKAPQGIAMVVQRYYRGLRGSCSCRSHGLR